MKCYLVHVHGRLDWTGVAPPSDADVCQPEGFYTHRHVLAASLQSAKAKALQSVRAKLEKDGWLSGSGAKLDLEVEEMIPAPIHKLLERAPGNVFYDEA